MDIDEHAHLTKMRCAHVKRLRVLELKQAKFGLHVPEYIITELDDLSQKIAAIDVQLNGAAVPSASPPGSTDSPPMVQVDIVFKGDFNALTPELQERMVRVLAAFVDLSPEQIRVIKAMKGSIILRVEMPKEAADRLLELYKSQDPAVEDAEIAEIRAVQASAAIGPETPDEELVRQINEGNQEAFSYLYDRYFSKVRLVVSRSIPDRTLAEDATVETFVRAFSSMKQFKDKESTFSSWLLRTASYTARNVYYKARISSDHSVPPPPALADDTQGVLEQDIVGMESKRLQEAIQQLPERDRQLIELIYIEGLSHREVAARTGVHSNHIALRLRRAIKRLRDWLRAEGLDVTNKPSEEPTDLES